MSPVQERRLRQGVPPKLQPAHETHGPKRRAQAGYSRPIGISWKIGEDFAHFCARQLGSLRTGGLNRQSSGWIPYNPCLLRTSFLQSQGNALSLKSCLPRVSPLQAAVSPGPAWGGHLSPLGKR